MTESPSSYFSSLHRCLAAIQVHGENSDTRIEPALELALEWILKLRQTQGKVIFIGNGGSAAIASHQAVDLWKNGGIRAMAFNDSSLLTCLSNDYGYEHVFEKPVEMFAAPGDILIAISSSGSSKNILRAVDMARVKGCTVITLSGFRPDNPLRCKGQLNFYVDSESYGFVEISHLTICHYLADRVMAQKEAAVPASAKESFHG